jgi:hypothetical protein
MSEYVGSAERWKRKLDEAEMRAVATEMRKPDKPKAAGYQVPKTAAEERQALIDKARKADEEAIRRMREKANE